MRVAFFNSEADEGQGQRELGVWELEYVPRLGEDVYLSEVTERQELEFPWTVYRIVHDIPGRVVNVYLLPRPEPPYHAMLTWSSTVPEPPFTLPEMLACQLVPRVVTL